MRIIRFSTLPRTYYIVYLLLSPTHSLAQFLNSRKAISCSTAPATPIYIYLRSKYTFYFTFILFSRWFRIYWFYRWKWIRRGFIFADQLMVFAWIRQYTYPLFLFTWIPAVQVMNHKVPYGANRNLELHPWIVYGAADTICQGPSEPIYFEMYTGRYAWFVALIIGSTLLRISKGNTAAFNDVKSFQLRIITDLRMCCTRTSWVHFCMIERSK